MFHFYNTFLNLFNISSLSSSGIIICSTFLAFSSVFTILTSFNLVTASVLSYFRITHLLYGLLFWRQFLKHLVLYPLIVFQSINLIANDKNDKNSYPLTYFLVLGFYRISSHFYLLISNLKLTLSSVYNGLPV